MFEFLKKGRKAFRNAVYGHGNPAGSSSGSNVTETSGCGDNKTDGFPVTLPALEEANSNEVAKLNIPSKIPMESARDNAPVPITECVQAEPKIENNVSNQQSKDAESVAEPVIICEVKQEHIRHSPTLQTKTRPTETSCTAKILHNAHSEEDEDGEEDLWEVFFENFYDDEGNSLPFATPLILEKLAEQINTIQPEKDETKEEAKIKATRPMPTIVPELAEYGVELLRKFVSSTHSEKVHNLKLGVELCKNCLIVLQHMLKKNGPINDMTIHTIQTDIRQVLQFMNTLKKQMIEIQTSQNKVTERLNKRAKEHLLRKNFLFGKDNQKARGDHATVGCQNSRFNKHIQDQPKSNQKAQIEQDNQSSPNTCNNKNEKVFQTVKSIPNTIGDQHTNEAQSSQNSQCNRNIKGNKIPQVKQSAMVSQSSQSSQHNQGKDGIQRKNDVLVNQTATISQNATDTQKGQSNPDIQVHQYAPDQMSKNTRGNQNVKDGKITNVSTKSQSNQTVKIKNIWTENTSSESVPENVSQPSTLTKKALYTWKTADGMNGKVEYANGEKPTKYTTDTGKSSQTYQSPTNHDSSEDDAHELLRQLKAQTLGLTLIDAPEKGKMRRIVADNTVVSSPKDLKLIEERMRCLYEISYGISYGCCQASPVQPENSKASPVQSENSKASPVQPESSKDEFIVDEKESHPTEYTSENLNDKGPLTLVKDVGSSPKPDMHDDEQAGPCKTFGSIMATPILHDFIDQGQKGMRVPRQKKTPKQKWAGNRNRREEKDPNHLRQKKKGHKLEPQAKPCDMHCEGILPKQEEVHTETGKVTLIDDVLLEEHAVLPTASSTTKPASMVPKVPRLFKKMHNKATREKLYHNHSQTDLEGGRRNGVPEREAYKTLEENDHGTNVVIRDDRHENIFPTKVITCKKNRR